MKRHESKVENWFREYAHTSKWPTWKICHFHIEARLANIVQCSTSQCTDSKRPILKNKHFLTKPKNENLHMSIYQVTESCKSGNYVQNLAPWSDPWPEKDPWAKSMAMDVIVSSAQSSRCRALPSMSSWLLLLFDPPENSFGSRGQPDFFAFSLTQTCLVSANQPAVMAPLQQKRRKAAIWRGCRMRLWKTNPTLPKWWGGCLDCAPSCLLCVTF